MAPTGVWLLQQWPGQRGWRLSFSFPQPCAPGSAKGKTLAAERKWGLSSLMKRGIQNEAELERHQEKVSGWRRKRVALLLPLWPGWREGSVSRLSPCLLNPHLSEEREGRGFWLRGAPEEMSLFGCLRCAPWQFGRGGRWAPRCSPRR